MGTQPPPQNPTILKAIALTNSRVYIAELPCSNRVKTVTRFEKEVLLLLRAGALLLWMLLITYVFKNYGNNTGSWIVITSMIIFSLLLSLTFKK